MNAAPKQSFHEYLPSDKLTFTGLTNLQGGLEPQITIPITGNGGHGEDPSNHL